MPFVNIRITKEGHVGKKEKNQLIQGVTKLLVDTLGKNPASIVVIIDEIDTDNYGLGGASITTVRKHAKKEQKLAAKAEKARLRAEKEAQAAALVPQENTASTPAAPAPRAKKAVRAARKPRTGRTPKAAPKVKAISAAAKTGSAPAPKRRGRPRKNAVK
jgi:4-oxalocrotonate tautomerase